MQGILCACVFLVEILLRFDLVEEERRCYTKGTNIMIHDGKAVFWRCKFHKAGCKLH